MAAYGGGPEDIQNIFPAEVIFTVIAIVGFVLFCIVLAIRIDSGDNNAPPEVNINDINYHSANNISNISSMVDYNTVITNANHYCANADVEAIHDNKVNRNKDKSLQNRDDSAGALDPDVPLICCITYHDYRPRDEDHEEVGEDCCNAGDCDCDCCADCEMDCCTDIPM